MELIPHILGLIFFFMVASWAVIGLEDCFQKIAKRLFQKHLEKSQPEGYSTFPTAG